MAKKKRVTRKELLKQPDEFITTTGRLIRFGMQYRKPLIVTAAGVFALILVLAVGNYFGERNESRAFNELSHLLDDYQAATLGGDAGQVLDKLGERFHRFLADHSERNGGRLGRVIFAAICLENGAYDQAVGYYRQALAEFPADSIYTPLIQTGLGHAYVGQGDLAAAAEQFEAAAAHRNPLADSALFNLGVIAGKTGRREQRDAAFKRITEDYPNSVYARIVKEKTAG